MGIIHIDMISMEIPIIKLGYVKSKANNTVQNRLKLVVVEVLRKKFKTMRQRKSLLYHKELIITYRLTRKKVVLIN